MRTHRRTPQPLGKFHWGNYHRQGPVDGEMGGTLFLPLLYTAPYVPSAHNAIDCMPIKDELDTEPTVEDLNKTIVRLASDKAPVT